MAEAQAHAIQCPNCGGRIDFDPSRQVAACRSCGSEFRPEELGEELPADMQGTGNGDEGQPRRHAVTGEDFFEQVEWHADTDDPMASMTRYSCSSCAAEIVADASAVATECPYCGNALVMAGDAGEVECPRDVIPFSLSREDAQKAIAEHLRARPYLPVSFSEKATLEHVRSVYVPYYRCDMHAEVDWVYADLERVGGHHRDPIWRLRRRCGEIDFAGIPVDGSSKFPDAYMDVLAPFPFDEAEPLSAAYLAGHLAEIPDESAEDTLARVSSLVELGTVAPMHRVLEENGHQVYVCDHLCHISETGHVVTLVPVWVMHYEYEGRNLLVCVNGVTGKCVSDLPISKPRTIPAYAAAALVASPILLMLAFAPQIFADSVSRRDGNAFAYALVTCVVLIFGAAAFFVSAYDAIRKSMNTTARMRDAGDYVVGDGMRTTRLQRSKSTYSSYLSAAQDADIMRDWQA